MEIKFDNWLEKHQIILFIFSGSKKFSCDKQRPPRATSSLTCYLGKYPPNPQRHWTLDTGAPGTLPRAYPRYTPEPVAEACRSDGNWQKTPWKLPTIFVIQIAAAKNAQGLFCNRKYFEASRRVCPLVRSRNQRLHASPNRPIPGQMKQKGWNILQ